MKRRRFVQLAACSAAVLKLPEAAHGIGVPVPIKFSFMLWAMAKQGSFERCLEIVAEAGYQGVELVGEFHAWSPERKRDVMARMRSLNLVFDSMSGVDAGFAVPKQSELFLTQFADHLQAAKELQCPQVILLSGSRENDPSGNVQRRTCIENLKRAGQMAAKESIDIVIEPIDLLENPSSYLASVTDGFEIVDAVNESNVKVLYDLYHEQRGFGNLVEKLERNLTKVGLIHVAGVPGRHEPESGEINYPAIYRKLAELRYGRWIAMEYYPTGDPVTSLRRSRSIAEQAFAYR